MIYLFKILLLLKNNNMANLINIETYNNSILNENKEIKTIIHISDIHIKNSCEREKEYNYVFNNLYEYIKKIKDIDKTLLVITGDILDSNIEKNCNINTKLFIENICKYIECIIILGNHDITNGQKYNEISKLESVLYNLKTKNPCHLLIKDGSYEYKNIIFGLTTMFNNKVTQIESNKIKIGLYHGTIKEICSNKHQYTNSGNFSIDEFKNYDYILLGDIHKRQQIKNGLYAGSLIQLDPSEDINKGGYKIDLNKKKIEEFNLINDTGFYKIVIDKKGKVKSNINIKKIPKNAKLIVENNSLNDDMQNKYIKDLEEKGVNVLEKKIVYKINNNLEKEIELLGNKYDLNNLRKKETISEIIKLYLTTEGKITDETKIKRILEKTEKMIDIKQQNLRHIKLNKLVINNISVFGSNNIIDFDILKKNKITNLYGINDVGKTSIIECLTLAITGKSTKKGIYSEFIHNKEDIGSLNLELLVNNDLYEIKRVYKRKDINYTNNELVVTRNKEIIDIKNKKDLENYIETNICTLEELLTSSIIEQERNYSLLMANNKLGEILKSINMNIYNEIIDLCKTKIKENTQNIKKISSNIEKYTNDKSLDTIKILNNYKMRINDIEVNIKEETNNNKISVDKILELEKERIRLKTLITINEDIGTYDEKLVEDKSKEHIEKTKILNEKKKKLIKLKKEYNKINNIDIENIKNNLDNCINNIQNDNNLDYDIEKCEKLLEDKTKKILELQNIEKYNSNETINIIENYIKYKKNLLLDEIKSKIKNINIDKFYNKNITNTQEEYDNLIKYLDMGPINIQQNINILENEIIFIKNRIKNIENNKKIKEYKEQIFEIEKNTLIANEIEKIKLEIINLQLNLDNIYKIILKENEKEESITKYGIYIKKLENTELNIKSL